MSTVLSCAVPTYTDVMFVVGSAVLVAYTLPLRLVWCSVQPLLVLSVCLIGSLMRYMRMSQSMLIDTHRPLGDKRKPTAYDVYAQLTGRARTRWDQVLFVYAAWIAYGALFHEAKHAAADLSLFDDQLSVSTVSSILSATRAVGFTLATCYSFSTAVANQVAAGWLAYAAYISLLLAVPPLNGVPHALSIHETLWRVLAFVWLFGVAEFMRLVTDHGLFVAELVNGTLDANAALKFGEATADSTLDGRQTAKSETIASVRLTTVPRGDASLASLVNARSHATVLPVSWSVLRSAWVLSVSSNWLSFGCVLVCVASAAYNCFVWSSLAAKLLSTAAQQRPPPVVSKSTPAATTTLNGSTLNNRRSYSPPTAAPSAQQQTPVARSSSFAAHIASKQPIIASRVEFARRIERNIAAAAESSATPKRLIDEFA